MTIGSLKISYAGGIGAVGNINGIYTAPASSYGNATVLVTDSEGATSNATVGILMDPDDIQAGNLQLWLKADAITGLTDGQDVIGIAIAR